jgi:hypothetical protein
VKPEAQLSTQVPSLQTLPAAQTVPQLPQLRLSVVVLVQTGAVAEVPVPEQAAAVQYAPASLAQTFWPEGQQAVGRLEEARQLCVQRLLTQLSPLGQTTPHEPQLFASSVSFAQYVGFEAGQAVKLSPQLSTQALDWQSLPFPHVAPQTPQLFGSSFRLAQ